MKHEVNYNLNEDKTFSIIFNNLSYDTSLTNERGVDALCKSIQIFMNNFSLYPSYRAELKLSDEYPSIGVIVDLWKETDDEPFGVAHYMFEDYDY